MNAIVTALQRAGLGARVLTDAAQLAAFGSDALTAFHAKAAVVVVQGDSKETLRLYGEPYAVARVRAAMFNAAIAWQEFALD